MYKYKTQEEKDNCYILSSSSSIKFTNSHKLDEIKDFIKEYKSLTQRIVDELWKDTSNVPTLIPKPMVDAMKTYTWLSTRIIQCSGKQASAIVRGTLKKYNDRLFRLDELKNNPYTPPKSIEKLQKLIDETVLSCPVLDNVTPELDSRFIKVDMDNSTSFDIWITISSIGDRKHKKKIVIPLKRTKHFNKMYDLGTMKPGLRLSDKKITFNFEFTKEEKTETTTVGIDVGQLNTITCSNGFSSVKNKDGYDLDKINNILSRKKKGGRGFEKASTHRTNYINWSVNQLNWKDISSVKVEDLKDVRRGRKSSRKLSHWTYTLILKKLKQKSLQEDVLFDTVNPAFTSQRCNHCGWTQKRNRNGKSFYCRNCGYAADSDFNASVNISLELPSVPTEVRLRKFNRKGFFWNPDTNFSLLYTETGSL
jgi:putative transposase